MLSTTVDNSDLLEHGGVPSDSGELQGDELGT